MWMGLPFFKALAVDLPPTSTGAGERPYATVRDRARDGLCGAHQRYGGNVHRLRRRLLL